MLIIKAFINLNKIDEIWIHNSGTVHPKTGKYKYTIVKPEIYKTLWHKRGDGYRPLLLKALKIIEENNV